MRGRTPEFMPTAVSMTVVLSTIVFSVILHCWRSENDLGRREYLYRRYRRRIAALTALLGLPLLLHQAVLWVSRPCPLAALSPGKFEATFVIDTQRFAECDRTFAHHLDLLAGYGDLFTPASTAVLSAEQERVVRDAWVSIYSCAAALEQIRSFHEDWYRLRPSPAQSRRRQKSFLLSYAVRLSLHEKSARLIRLIGSNRHAVRFLNGPHPQARMGPGTFRSLRRQLQSSHDRTLLFVGRAYLYWLRRAARHCRVARGQDCDWLWSKIDAETRLAQNIPSLESVRLSLGSDLGAVGARLYRLWFPAQKKVVEWMGDTKLRRIGSSLITAKQLRTMQPHLEPGDILLMRKNWYLSNIGLPGFWPHAELYIGPPRQLETFANQPEVLAFMADCFGREMSLTQYLHQEFPHHWEAYLSGSRGQSYCIIQALSEGVVLSTLKQGAGDYLAALRPRLSAAVKAQAIMQAFRYLDKPYDFDFDFASDHALVCTELVWRCYRPTHDRDGLRFTLVEIAARQTLPANEIAGLYVTERRQPDRQLDFVYFLDASESRQESFVAEEAAFVESYQRTKWDLAQK